MTRVYDEKGQVVPVTVVQAGPCAVTQVKTVETDGYNAVQLGFGDIKAKFSTFPLIGHAAKAGVGPKKAFREIKLKERQAGRDIRQLQDGYKLAAVIAPPILPLALAIAVFFIRRGREREGVSRRRLR